MRNLIGDGHGRFVVSPHHVVAGVDLQDRLSVDLAWSERVLPLAYDAVSNRLLLGVLDLESRAEETVEALAKVQVVVVRLDVYGGEVPTWSDIDGPAETPPRLRYEHPERTERLLAVALSRVYPPEAPPDTSGDPGRGDSVLGHLLSSAVKMNATEIWVQGIDRGVQLVGRVGDTWEKLMSLSYFHRHDLLDAMRRRAGLPPGLGHGTFTETVDGQRCQVKLEILPAEFMEEARLYIE